MFSWDLNTSVADRNPDRIARCPRLHSDLTAVLDCLRRVDKNVHEHLVQLVRQTFDLGNVAKLFHDANAVSQLMLQQRKRALDALMNIDRLPFGLVESGEVLEASHGLHNAIRRDLIVAAYFTQEVEQAADFFIWRRSEQLAYLCHRARHDVVITVNRSHRSIDFVRHTSDK